MKLTCCAVNADGARCRKTNDLTRVQIMPHYSPYSLLLLPPTVVIDLCPKHFVMRSREKAATA
jgi:hypothetical protein